MSSSQNGKGDNRRPMQIDERQLEFNWNRTFSKSELSFNTYRIPQNAELTPQNNEQHN